ncbi:MAG: hypothetical protein ACTSP9_03120 [Promethearchaeota archaeon]
MSGQRLGITKTFRLITPKELTDNTPICSFPKCMYNAVWFMNSNYVPFCDKHFLEYIKELDICLVVSKKALKSLKEEINGKTIKYPEPQMVPTTKPVQLSKLIKSEDLKIDPIKDTFIPEEVIVNIKETEIITIYKGNEERLDEKKYPELRETYPLGRYVGLVDKRQNPPRISFLRRF